MFELLLFLGIIYEAINSSSVIEAKVASRFVVILTPPYRTAECWQARFILWLLLLVIDGGRWARAKYLCVLHVHAAYVGYSGGEWVSVEPICAHAWWCEWSNQRFESDSTTHLAFYISISVECKSLPAVTIIKQKTRCGWGELIAVKTYKRHWDRLCHNVWLIKCSQMIIRCQWSQSGSMFIV